MKYKRIVKNLTAFGGSAIALLGTLYCNPKSNQQSIETQALDELKKSYSVEQIENMTGVYTSVIDGKKWIAKHDPKNNIYGFRLEDDQLSVVEDFKGGNMRVIKIGDKSWVMNCLTDISEPGQICKPKGPTSSSEATILNEFANIALEEIVNGNAQKL